MNPVTTGATFSSADSATHGALGRSVDPSRHLDHIASLLADVDAPIDVRSLHRRCLGDSPFCGIILHKFAARAYDQLAALERALASHNVTELADRAHALKGVALNVSAAGLAERCAVLERAARQADASLAELVASTGEELMRCVRAVPQILLNLQQEA